MRPPSFHLERALAQQGYSVVGVDEAGCGCLAGPVVAAACHLPLDSRIGLLRDSKLLSVQQRERAFAFLAARGARWAVGSASAEEIDALNIRQATYLAMRRAVAAFLAVSLNGLRCRGSPRTPAPVVRGAYRRTGPSYGRTTTPYDDTNSDTVQRMAAPFALVDAWTIPQLPIPQHGIIHGDRLVKSIAAASIIAKVTRDAMMAALDREYPQYGFAIHKGYATASHRKAIRAHGLSVCHRTSFCSASTVVR